jgi:hypothetical protein
MKRRLLARRPSPAMLVAVVALVSSLTGGAVAATLIDSGDIKNGSIKKKDLHKNSVNTKKVKNKTLKAKDFAPGQLEQGAQGIQGPKGDPGQDATNLWAVVHYDGATTTASLVRGSGAVSAERTADGTGTYEVVFNQDITDCSYQGTLGRGDTDSTEAFPGEITVVRRGPAANPVVGGLYVQTFNSAGAPNDRSFHIAVFC